MKYKTVFVLLVTMAMIPVARGMELIAYEIIERVSTKNVKLSIDIEVPLVSDRLPTEEELAEISSHLVSNADEHDVSFITFYLPGMEVGAGAFATAHHNPEMQVNIMPFMLLAYPQYEQFVE